MTNDTHIHFLGTTVVIEVATGMKYEKIEEIADGTKPPKLPKKLKAQRRRKSAWRECLTGYTQR